MAMDWCTYESDVNFFLCIPMENVGGSAISSVESTLSSYIFSHGFIDQNA